MSLPRRVGSTYSRIWRTYRSWAPSLLLLALVVFVPLALLDALTMNVELESLDLTNGIKVAALVLAVGAITATGLIGEVFFSGAIAISLTHPHGEDPPPLREIARRLNYGRLIAVDLVYVVGVAVGLLLGILPGLLVFVWFGLAGPVVELEERTARGALTRSMRLVWGNFWLVLWVLLPIQVIGDGIGHLLAALVHDLFGHTFLATWLAEAVTDIALSPIFAIAAVLLTLDLIAARNEQAPSIRATPVPA
ncbi:MAG: hypothetical protein E6G51_11515 [Actinobacteria bacterium]|nr:MAG: hypothetical protein E6G51_11515 [Actinomycetota bacterium]